MSDAWSFAVVLFEIYTFGKVSERSCFWHGGPAFFSSPRQSRDLMSASHVPRVSSDCRLKRCARTKCWNT
jgi:hypothetical protein